MNANVWSDPIVVLSIVIIVSTVALIAAGVFGIDKGVLAGMARADFARGLITYLFAIVTIGIAVALVLSALVGPEPSDAHGGRFQQGKEILSLLLGVFGTIVGFYFGSETAKASRPDLQEIRVSSLELTPQPLKSGDVLTIRAAVIGGTPPYKFGIAEGNDKLELNDIAGDGGWIRTQFRMRPVSEDKHSFVRLFVQDASGKSFEQAAPVKISA